MPGRFQARNGKTSEGPSMPHKQPTGNADSECSKIHQRQRRQRIARGLVSIDSQVVDAAGVWAMSCRSAVPSVG